jgi:hypothetical protein
MAQSAHLDSKTAKDRNRRKSRPVGLRSFLRRARRLGKSNKRISASSRFGAGVSWRGLSSGREPSELQFCNQERGSSAQAYEAKCSALRSQAGTGWHGPFP